MIPTHKNALTDWKRGDEITAKHLQEAVESIQFIMGLLGQDGFVSSASGLTFSPPTVKLIAEGYLTEAMSAATDYATGPSTATMRTKRRISGNLTDGPEITLTNRDESLSGEVGYYIIAIRVNNEWRPIWVSCSAVVGDSSAV